LCNCRIYLSSFSILSIAAVCHIRLSKIKTSTLHQILGTDVYHCAKFHQNRANTCRDVAAAILDLLGAYWDCPRWQLDGPYASAKLGWSQCCSFDSMKLQYFGRSASKCLSMPPKLGFLGNFNPKMWSNINKTPERHTLARDHVVWAIKRENLSTGLTYRWVPEKGINGKKICYVSRICPEAPYGRICTKFGTAIGAADVITCTKFFGDRLRGVDSLGGSKIVIAHWQGQSPLTQGWRYRAACNGMFPCKDVPFGVPIVGTDHLWDQIPQKPQSGGVSRLFQA